MHDSADTAAGTTTAAGEPAVPGTPRVRVWTVVALLATTVLLAAAAVTAVFLTADSDDGPAFAVGDCVEIDGETEEHDCADHRSRYRIVARAEQAGAAVDACLPHRDATRAVLEPGGTPPAVLLCLAPTRFNATDAGSVQPGDCVSKGTRIVRLPCGAGLKKVVAAELHPGMPVTEPVCRDQPQTRLAYAEQSLAGRAIVLCVVDLNINALLGAAVGDCIERNRNSVVPCDDQRAHQRLLSVRTTHGQPMDPECFRVAGAESSTVVTGDTTAFVTTFCLGPIDRSHVAYAVLGECLYAGENLRRIGCTDPAAGLEVIARFDTDGWDCPPQTTGRIMLSSAVMSETTLCTVDR
ncbi:hypothetical protein [Nocardia sp. NPDC057353]|uniref:LppU/SCO3897 family protein n=1 Tax=Nocardia sp. NPDC057353 TaxID=3346104 RepID=UPI003626B6EF